MKDVSNSLQAMFAGENGGANDLVQYIHSLNPEAIAQLSTPTPEVRQAMEASLTSLLGGLPPQHFGVTVTTSRESLGQLLASAMMNGYFLHSAQQRMTIEQSFASLTTGQTDSNNDETNAEL
ncbi:MAG: DUF760 domain-containing protein [Leptolyngbyaceae bacterium]|nr:DUF760 domain-containing protein [Leptolyngbyaceae bacterium]